MCKRMLFGLLFKRLHQRHPKVLQKRTTSRVRTTIKKGRIVKHLQLRHSPRLNNLMPTVIEHLQFTIDPNVLELRIIRGPDKILTGSDETYKYLSVEKWFYYPDLKKYYGPSNIVHVLKFIEMIKQHKLNGDGKIACLVTKSSSDQAINTILMATFYMVLEMGISLAMCMETLTGAISLCQWGSYKTEGSLVEDDLFITIKDCINGILDFISLNLLHLNEIDIDEVVMREYPSNGDMNWIIPGKILALAGPTEEVYPIDEFIYYAKNNNIRAMFRLNKASYPTDLLETSQIKHYEMYMNDGGIPSLSQIDEFYELADEVWRRNGAVAVHCRAGLGRTGTMIATYLIRKFNLKASNVIAFLRMMRPGSVLSIQARFLDSIQYRLRGETTPLAALFFLRSYYPEESDHLIEEVSSDSDATFSEESEMVEITGTKMILSLSSRKVRVQL